MSALDASHEVGHCQCGAFHYAAEIAQPTDVRRNAVYPAEAAATKETNPKDNAATTRLDLSLFPSTARIYGALAMTEGDLKYGGFNWRVAGVKASVYVAACARHLEKWWDGEDCDPITKVPHLANAIACMAVLVDAIESQKLVDDRPPRANTGKLLTACEATVKHLQTLFPNRVKRYTEKP